MAGENQGALSPEQAFVAIASFFLVEGMQLDTEAGLQLGIPTVKSNPDLGPLLSFNGELGTYQVSPRGHVVYYAGTALRPAERPVRGGEIADIASSFAERHVEDFKIRHFIHGSPKIDGSSFEIEWTEQPRTGKETAIFPNWVQVVVEIPSGRITRFSASDLRLVRTTSPAITEASARERIRQQFGKAAIEDIELLVLPGNGGRTAITVWSAMVMTLAPEGPVMVRVTLDADTGKVISE